MSQCGAVMVQSQRPGGRTEEGSHAPSEQRGRPGRPRREHPKNRPARRWALVYVVLALVPLGLSVRVGRMTTESFAGEVSLSTGLVAASLLVCAYALPSRLRSLSIHLGIETLLRSHRAIALTAGVLVLLHVALVVVADPSGPAVLDLRSAPPRVWAGSTATFALLGLVVLAVSRRRRRPRYEGWRLVHIALATVVVLGTALHVWWLHHLVTDAVMALWFATLALLLLAVLAYRWAWRPLRAFSRPTRSSRSSAAHRQRSASCCTHVATRGCRSRRVSSPG